MVLLPFQVDRSSEVSWCHHSVRRGVALDLLFLVHADIKNGLSFPSRFLYLPLNLSLLYLKHPDSVVKLIHFIFF